ncbi:DUF5067 domain-containing protein [Lactobacillus terrae]|uniref:DUF5067 domain-containing protein n=1 Tax=Lactobacillus terrae TaxID=2269374 RepID=UPI0015CFACC7|nr:DUF5067 domain-containing protein [Lactobacillus terrae]
MKKYVFGLLTIFSVFIISACSVKNTENKTSDDTKTVKKENSKKEKYYFKNNKLVMQDVDINITDEKIIQPGETGNEYGEKPVIAFWYETTNKTNKEINPMTAWISAFKAIQDNNKNSVNELDVGMLPDEQFLDSQSENIKKNGTVKNAISYELDDTNTPVQLTATKGYDETKLGTMTYNLK